MSNQHRPEGIHVGLTGRDLYKHEVQAWCDFWNDLIRHPKWVSKTTYRFRAPESPGGRVQFNRRPMAELSSLTRFSTKEEAKEKTKAAQEILRGLGFVDNPGRGIPGRLLRGIWMKWDPPNRERLERTMPGLVKGGLLRDVNYPVDVPSAEWIKYIEWEKSETQANGGSRW